MRCHDLTKKRCHQCGSPSDGHQGDMAYVPKWKQSFRVKQRENLSNETGKVLPKLLRFHNLLCSPYTKTYFLSLLWKITRLERPQNLVCHCIKIVFLAATKQLNEWFSPSVRPSVCLSVCMTVTPFSLCSHHRIIMKFSGVIHQWQKWCPCKKSRSEVKGQGRRGQNPT